MSRFKTIHLAARWLVTRYRLLLAVAGGCLLFVLLALLSHIDVRPAAYGAGLCLFFTLAACVCDFVRFRTTALRLGELLQSFPTGLEPLPEPRGEIEALYQRLVRALYEERGMQLANIQQERSEREDYYTLWVHQIKTPIAALRLLLHSGDSVREGFAMEQELFKIEQYADMALQYLRLESLSYDLVLKEHDLYVLVKQAVKKYSHTFIRKRLTLTLEAFDLKVVTDEKWMLFVLEQLLSNCVKYTNTGGVRIAPDPQEPRALFICDTGIGIKPEDLPRIFDRGFTGYNGRMDKTSTGIGLYLCKKVTDRLAVTLTVSSTLHKGTRYRLYFPPQADFLQK